MFSLCLEEQNQAHRTLNQRKFEVLKLILQNTGLRINESVFNVQGYWNYILLCRRTVCLCVRSKFLWWDIRMVWLCYSNLVPASLCLCPFYSLLHWPTCLSPSQVSNLFSYWYQCSVIMLLCVVCSYPFSESLQMFNLPVTYTNAWMNEPHSYIHFFSWEPH